MVIIYGTRLCGVVDEMPDGSYVATRFFHIMYIPILPLRTYWVISEEGRSFRGHRLPLSLKSILVAFLRTFLLALGLGAIAVGILAMVEGVRALPESIVDLPSFYHYATTRPFLLPIAGATIAVLCLLAHRFSKKVLRASPERQEAIIRSIVSQ